MHFKQFEAIVEHVFSTFLGGYPRDFFSNSTLFHWGDRSLVWNFPHFLMGSLKTWMFCLPNIPFPQLMWPVDHGPVTCSLRVQGLHIDSFKLPVACSCHVSPAYSPPFRWRSRVSRTKQHCLLYIFDEGEMVLLELLNIHIPSETKYCSSSSFCMIYLLHEDIQNFPSITIFSRTKCPNFTCRIKMSNMSLKWIT